MRRSWNQVARELRVSSGAMAGHGAACQLDAACLPHCLIVSLSHCMSAAFLHSIAEAHGDINHFVTRH
jgi:hypothetical protein